METIDAIMTRRSIRAFRSDPVPPSAIQTALCAAMNAPSAGNEQPWQFAVIDDRGLLDTVPSFHPHSQMIVQAPLAILVCGDLDRETHKGYWMVDCAAATQNLLLAVHDQGLAAVWLGIFPRQDRIDAMRRLLQIPSQIVPFALIPIGYAAETKGPQDRFDLGRVHHNAWSSAPSL
jgi:nitroreductase